jgi:hypothetical protein
MNRITRIATTLTAIALISGGIVGPAFAAEKRAEIVREADIQAQIDQQVDRQAADRQTVETLLGRADVRRVAATAGIDMRRVEAAAATLSASELSQIAARADEATGVAGGVETVTLTVTTIIIILLLIIIIAK